MIRAMAVIGTGLIGTSVALAASRQGVTVFLSDRDPAAARTAAALGAGRVEPPPGLVDLAVLAVPPSKVGHLLVELQERGLARTYTDVGSVKAEPERVVLGHAPDPSGYVGGHPMAGRERSGPLAARADLFRGRPWALTPSPLTSGTAMDRALELVDLCGGVPVVTQSRAHDEAVALTSHVPHLVASLMAARLRGTPDGMRRFAGQGLRDVTRIARGDSRLWSDILQSNADAVVGVVRDLHADLSRLVSALDQLAEPDGMERAHGVRTLAELLERGIEGVAGIPPLAAGAPADETAVRVSVPDRPGELARLLASVAGHGVGADDATVASAGEAALTVRLTVPSDVADLVAAEIEAEGWGAVCEADVRSGVSAAG
jgi:prephenate dehydrogenase